MSKCFTIRTLGSFRWSEYFVFCLNTLSEYFVLCIQRQGPDGEDRATGTHTVNGSRVKGLDYLPLLSHTGRMTFQIIRKIESIVHTFTQKFIYLLICLLHNIIIGKTTTSVREIISL